MTATATTNPAALSPGMNKFLKLAVSKFNAKVDEVIPWQDLQFQESDFVSIVRQPDSYTSAIAFLDEVGFSKGEYFGGMVTVILALISDNG